MELFFRVCNKTDSQQHHLAIIQPNLSPKDLLSLCSIQANERSIRSVWALDHAPGCNYVSNLDLMCLMLCVMMEPQCKMSQEFRAASRSSKPGRALCSKESSTESRRIDHFYERNDHLWSNPCPLKSSFTWPFNFFLPSMGIQS